MNWSLEKRFEKDKFLTPVLLDYNHDEDGNLIINDEETRTVKLVYYLYLADFPSIEMAQILADIGWKTKLGNTK